VSDNFFGRGRSYQVGDVITVLLNESTQAARTQNSTLSRKSSNDVVPTGLQNKVANMGGLLGGANLLGGSIENKGAGTADQRASLEGSVAVTVVDVLANGNLVLRGEKQLALTEGTEVIQVAGVIRPEDVAPNNTVQSRRLANAQITYRGTGDLAAATRAGWGTSALIKLWPF
jgi:flagellar L-ring protein precursor FlgH